MIAPNTDFFVRNAAKNAAKFNLIWTNRSPGDAFEDKTIPLELSNVTTIMVIFRVSRAIESLNPPMLIPAGQTARCVSDALTAGTIYRNVSYTDEGVIFSASTNTSGCIPYAIYAVDF